MKKHFLLSLLAVCSAIFATSCQHEAHNALDCAHTVGAPVPMTAQVQEIMQWMHNHEGGQKDHSAIAQYYEFLTGEKIGQ